MFQPDPMDCAVLRNTSAQQARQTLMETPQRHVPPAPSLAFMFPKARPCSARTCPSAARRGPPIMTTARPQIAPYVLGLACIFLQVLLGNADVSTARLVSSITTTTRQPLALHAILALSISLMQARMFAFQPLFAVPTRPRSCLRLLQPIVFVHVLPVSSTATTARVFPAWHATSAPSISLRRARIFVMQPKCAAPTRPKPYLPPSRPTAFAPVLSDFSTMTTVQASPVSLAALVLISKTKPGRTRASQFPNATVVKQRSHHRPPQPIVYALAAAAVVMPGPALIRTHSTTAWRACRSPFVASMRLNYNHPPHRPIVFARVSPSFGEQPLVELRST